jgi:hypothetical protein
MTEKEFWARFYTHIYRECAVDAKVKDDLFTEYVDGLIKVFAKR